MAREPQVLSKPITEAKLITPSRSFPRAIVAELRPHQWTKNALVLLPMMLAPGMPTLPMIFQGVLAAGAFSLCASAGYVLNDLLDIEADRAHPTKCKRPFASGDLPTAFGPFLLGALLLTSFAGALFFLPRGFVVMMTLYFVGTVSYSLFLKRQLLLDVLVLAGLYTHRILAGGVATGVHVSAWLLGFSMFLFTSLAFVKRYVELRGISGTDKVMKRGYYRTDLEMVTSMGTASGYIAALVFMLYVESGAVKANYREPGLLWLVLPILLYWLGRIWLLAGRDQMRDDPVKFALTDSHSLACGVAIAFIAVLARFTPEWLATAVR
jgi:4-hydroxybenzoate polyprenyltransferase